MLLPFFADLIQKIPVAALLGSFASSLLHMADAQIHSLLSLTGVIEPFVRLCGSGIAQFFS